MPEDKVPPYEVKQDDKVCPLRMIGARNQCFNPSTIQDMPYCECIKAKCAWWESTWGLCSVTVAATELNCIRKFGIAIAQRDRPR